MPHHQTGPRPRRPVRTLLLIALIAMPDPSPDGSLIFRNDRGKVGSGPDSAKFKAAERACKTFLDQTAPDRSDGR